MNVLGISGTPRKNGNSEILLQYALNPLKKQGCKVKHFSLRKMIIQPCRGCEECKKMNKCIINDDMDHIYEAFRWCDALIISSPVYSRNICSQLMAVLDRHYAVNIERPLEGKVGGAIAVGRGTCGGQSIAINSIYTWLLACGVICVPGELHGVTAVASEPGDILKQEKRLRQAEILGVNVLNIAKKLRAKTSNDLKNKNA
ncbi:MAG: flavodoxin family protein, partial [Candidatus Firestonebacteria bacterium]